MAGAMGAPLKGGQALKGMAPQEEKPDFNEVFYETLTGSGDLWLVYAIKGFMSFSYFALFNILTLFLSDDFGASDSTAGWIYGGHGVAVGVLSMFGGMVVDKLGFRRAMLIGSSFLVVSFFIIAWATELRTVVITLLTLKSIGSAITMPALVVAVRRYSTARNRSLAFSLFYALMNLSGGLSVLGVSLSRDYLAGGAWMPGYEGYVSTWRATAALAFVAACMQLCVCLLLKPSEAETNPSAQELERQNASVSNITRQVMSESKFQRFLLLILMFVGVRSIFRHLDVTFPKYFIRSFGENARFELFFMINPFLILVLAPSMTYVIHHYGLTYPQVFQIGATLSGISPLFLAVETSYAMCCAFIITLTLGEAFWSPKLYEYSVAIAPVGREASYSGLSGIPMFLSAGLIGGFSGHAVEEFCPSAQECHGRTLWLVISATALMSPLGLLLLNRFLYDPEDLKEAALGGRRDDEALQAEAAGSGPQYGATGATGSASAPGRV